jgi:hypothetical protein
MQGDQIIQISCVPFNGGNDICAAGQENQAYNAQTDKYFFLHFESAFLML